MAHALNVSSKGVPIAAPCDTATWIVTSTETMVSNPSTPRVKSRFVDVRPAGSDEVVPGYVNARDAERLEESDGREIRMVGAIPAATVMTYWH